MKSVIPGLLTYAKGQRLPRRLEQCFHLFRTLGEHIENMGGSFWILVVSWVWQGNKEWQRCINELDRSRRKVSLVYPYCWEVLLHHVQRNRTSVKVMDLPKGWLDCIIDACNRATTSGFFRTWCRTNVRGTPEVWGWSFEARHKEPSRQNLHHRGIAKEIKAKLGYQNFLPRYPNASILNTSAGQGCSSLAPPSAKNMTTIPQGLAQELHRTP